MFTTSLENNVTHVNDRNEYHVAEGISATVFRAILVSASKCFYQYVTCVNVRFCCGCFSVIILCSGSIFHDTLM